MPTLISTDGERLQMDGRLTLQQQQQLVGGYIEAVYLENGQVFIINEDGKNLKLPLNAAATLLVAHRLRHGDCIVGPAILFSAEEWEAEKDDP